MPDNNNRTTETEIAVVTLIIASQRTDKTASFDLLRSEIPKHITLTSEDKVMSVPRPNEQMWEQRIRNIKSHDKDAGNFIYEGYLEHVEEFGYKITAKGEAFLRDS
jgi:hypothetical protein